MDVEHLLQCANCSATNCFTGIVPQQYLCVLSAHRNITYSARCPGMQISCEIKALHKLIDYKTSTLSSNNQSYRYLIMSSYDNSVTICSCKYFLHCTKL
jgi:hypothetical protein